jgi:hypothetical protein
MVGSLRIAAALPALSRRALAQSKQVSVYNCDTYIGDDPQDFTNATLHEAAPGQPGLRRHLSFRWVRRANCQSRPAAAARCYEDPEHGECRSGVSRSEVRSWAQAQHGYFRGTVGLGYRKSKGSPKKLADVFEADTYAGRIALLSSTDSALAALKYRAHSRSTTSPAEIEEAVQSLIKVKPRIKTFAPRYRPGSADLAEVDVCLEYNGDILQVMQEDKDLAYVVPAEGSQLWVDSMCIPKGGPNPENARTFINFILDGEVHGAIAAFPRYPCPTRRRSSSYPRRIAPTRLSTLPRPCSHSANCRSTRASGSEPVCRCADRMLAA